VPLWLRYVLTLCVFIPLAVVALIYFRHQAGSPAAESPAAVVRSNESARAAVQRDQAVHRATGPASLTPAAALEQAILADVRASIADRVLAGPAGKVTCGPFGKAPASELAFSCNALAGGIGYRFRGVVDVRTRALAWCKDDRIAEGGYLDVPLSPACT
jgi:hypothetical protein